MSRGEWEEGIRAFDEESGGLMSLVVIDPSEAVALVAAALIGDPTAGRLVTAMRQTIRHIERAPRKAPALCLTCPVSLHRKFLVCLGVPEKTGPENCIGAGVCLKCAADRAALLPKIVEAFRAIWPSGRVVSVTHPEGGRA